MKKLKTYSIHELHRLEKNKNQAGSGIEKNSFSKDIHFTSELTQEIEDRLLQPFVDQSLKDFIPTPLISYEYEYARKTKEGWKTLQEYVKKIDGGIKALRKAGIWTEFDASNSLSSPLLDEKKSPKEVLGISDEVMNLSYEEACRQYKNRHYTEASNILEVLLYLNPAPDSYWQLLGMVEHEAGHFESAVKALSIGLEKGSLSLLPYAHLINSLASLKRSTEAVQMIHIALQIEHPVESDASAIQQALISLKQALIGGLSVDK